MWALLRAPLGLGTDAGWLGNYGRRLRIDAVGVTLHRYSRIEWRSVRRVGVSRSYIDGHACQVSLHHEGGVSRIDVQSLPDGERIVQIILAMFKQAHRSQHSSRRVDEKSIAPRDTEGRGRQPMPAGRGRAADVEFQRRNDRLKRAFVASKGGPRLLAEIEERI
jgi:hypothetical protein